MASSDTLFESKAIPQVPLRRSLRPLDKSHAGTVSQGELAVVYLQDCLPNSDYDIDVSLQMQSLALKVPLISGNRVYVNFYKCLYRNMQEHFDMAVSQGPFGDIQLNPPRLRFECLSQAAYPGIKFDADSSTPVGTILPVGMNLNPQVLPTLAQRRNIYGLFGPGSLLDRFGMSWLPSDYSTAPDLLTNSQLSAGWLQWDYINPLVTSFDPTVTHQFWLSAFPFQAYKLVYKYYHLKKHLLTQVQRRAWFGELYENDSVTRLTGDFLIGSSYAFDKGANFFFYHGTNVQVGSAALDGQVFTQAAGNLVYGIGSTVKVGSTTYIDGKDAVDLCLLTTHYSDLPGDYFVDARPTPVLGTAPQASVQGSLDFSNVVVPRLGVSTDHASLLGLDGAGSGLGVVYSDASEAYTFRMGFNPVSNVLFSNGSTLFPLKLSDRFESNGVLLKDVLNRATFSGFFSYDSLRLLQSSTLWLEAHSRINWTYNNFMISHFGQSAGAPENDRPEYLGGFSQDVNVASVFQTSESTANSELGTQAGRSFSQGSHRVCHTHFSDYGLIIGIMHVLPENIYTHRIPREWTKQSTFDYYFPEFADMPPQEIRNHELCNIPTLVDSDSPSGFWNDNVYGYQGAWDEYRNTFNYISGELNGYYSDWRAWTQHRDLSRGVSTVDQAPNLSRAFVSSRGNIDKTAFSTSDSFPQYIFRFDARVRAVLPIPQTAVPKNNV